jgi:hypothetical protein
VTRPDRCRGGAVFAGSPRVELRQRLDDSVDAGLGLQLGQSLPGDLLDDEFIADPGQQDRALLLMGEPGMVHNLFRIPEHARRVYKSLDE